MELKLRADGCLTQFICVMVVKLIDVRYETRLAIE